MFSTMYSIVCLSTRQSGGLLFDLRQFGFLITEAADDWLPVVRKNASTARTRVFLDLQALFLRSPSVSLILDGIWLSQDKRNEDMGDHMLGRCSRKRYLFLVGIKKGKKKLSAGNTGKGAEKFLARLGGR